MRNIETDNNSDVYVFGSLNTVSPESIEYLLFLYWHAHTHLESQCSNYRTWHNYRLVDESQVQYCTVQYRCDSNRHRFGGSLKAIRGIAREKPEYAAVIV